MSIISNHQPEVVDEVNACPADEFPTAGDRHFRRSEQIGALAGALAKAQGEMKNAAKDSANPFYRSKYADLASTWDACRAPLAANGLAVMQFPRRNGDCIEVETILAHASGEWASETLELPASKLVKDEQGNVSERFDAQTMGSAITYARRYALSALTGVAPEDDDGNAVAAGAIGKPTEASAVAKAIADWQQEVRHFETAEQINLAIPLAAGAPAGARPQIRAAFDKRARELGLKLVAPNGKGVYVPANSEPGRAA